jgi:hypothetical protein
MYGILETLSAQIVKIVFEDAQKTHCTTIWNNFTYSKKAYIMTWSRWRFCVHYYYSSSSNSINLNERGSRKNRIQTILVPWNTTGTVKQKLPVSNDRMRTSYFIRIIYSSLFVFIYLLKTLLEVTHSDQNRENVRKERHRGVDEKGWPCRRW